MPFVYLLCDSGQENCYKIGMTRGKIEKRIKQLQTGNSEEITLLKYHETEYPFFLEKSLHNKFKNKQKNSEWFVLDFDDVQKFNEHCLKIEEIAKSLEDNPFAKKILK